MLTKEQLSQLQNAISFLENQDSSTKTLKSIDSTLFTTNTTTVNENKNELKDYNGEKVDGFRKQGEYGAKKFIKP